MATKKTAPVAKITPAERVAMDIREIADLMPNVGPFGQPSEGTNKSNLRNWISGLHDDLARPEQAAVIGITTWRALLADAWAAEHEAHELQLRLRVEVKSLRDRMDDTLNSLANGYAINSLGEVQGRGLDVDRLCALAYDAAQRMTKSWFRAIRAGAPTELLSEWARKHNASALEIRDGAQQQ